MTETKTSPYAKAALIIAFVYLFITILIILSLPLIGLRSSLAPLVSISAEHLGKVGIWTLFGGLFVNVYVLTPLTLLVILIGIVHKLKTGKECAAWGWLGIAFLITCVSAVGMFYILAQNWR